MTSLVDVVRYANPNARARGMKSLLLSDRDMKMLLGAKTLGDIAGLLDGMPYSKDIRSVDSLTVKNLEDALTKNLLDANKKILKIVDSDARDFFAFRLKKYEIAVLKELITSKIENTLVETVDELMLSPRIRKMLPKLLEAGNIDDLLELLHDTEYGEALKKTGNSETTLALTLALDLYYYNKLLEKVNLLKKKNDKKIAKKFITTEIDVTNLMTMLRCKKLGVEPGGFLIPAKTGFFEITKKYMTAESVEDFVEKISETVYGRLLKKHTGEYERTKSLQGFEIALKRHLLQKNRNLMKGYPFQMGSILGYLKLKETEIENLRAIVVGIGNGLSADEVEGLLII